MYFCSLALSRLHKIICLVLFFILIQHNCTSAQTTVDARLDSINMFIGHQVHLYLSVDCDKTSKVSFPVFKNREFITDGVEVLETSEDKESPLDNDRKRIDKVYTLTSFEDSLYVIPALKITVDGNEYYSKRLALKVMTLNTDSIDVDKFFPPKDVQKNPFSLKEWLLVILLIMLFCISLFILVRNAKRLKRK